MEIIHKYCIMWENNILEFIYFKSLEERVRMIVVVRKVMIRRTLFCKVIIGVKDDLQVFPQAVIP